MSCSRELEIVIYRENIYSRFHVNSEAIASEFLENLE